MERFCNSSWSQIVQLLKSNIETGMSEKDCELLKRRKGRNIVDLPDKVKTHKFILDALKQKNIYIYIAIVFILFWFKKYLWGGVIIGIFAINIIINIIYAMHRNLAAGNLEKVLSSDVVVVRDSLEQLISSEELVYGDIVRLAPGNIVPADIRIIKSNELVADESILLGEQSIKAKNSEIILSDSLQLTEMSNIAFKGSSIIGGDGLGVVIEIGNSTVIGKLLTMIKSSNNRKHSFKDEVYNKFDQCFAILFVIIMAGWAALYFSGMDTESTFLVKGVFALGCLPVSIIGILSYNLIVNKYAKRGINLINFSIFNLINDINIIFLDKIGAISHEEMNVSKLYVNEKIIDKDDVYKKEMTIDRLIEMSVICNNATYDIGQDSGEGDMKEVAFLSYAARKKISKATVDINNSKMFEMPEDPEKKFMTVITRVKGRFRANVRGNLDTILENCTHIMLEGIERELTEELRNKIKFMDMNFSTEGLITVGFAYRNFNYLPSKSENIESNMVFVGMFGLENPLKNNIKNDIRNLKDRGIVPILFTDESKLSAITNGLKSEIIRNKSQVVAGIELDSLNPEELKELAGRVRIFCRVTPEIKAQIVALFVKDGYNVAAVGDSLNDLQTLNLANVGISRGNAPEMVKNLSDVFIKENYLEGLFEIKKYSAELKTNIRRGFKLFFNALFVELVLMIACVFWGQAESVSFVSLFIANGLILLPLIVITILKSGKESSIIGMFIRSAVLSIISLISMYKVEMPEVQIIPLIYISMDLLFLTVCNSGVSLRKISNELILSIVTFFAIIIAVVLIITFNSIVVRDVIMGEIIVSVFIFLVYEILAKKWQNS